MNLDAVFDDLEASFEHLQPRGASILQLQPAGFERVTFGADHFAGFIENTSVWRLTMFVEPIRLVPGSSMATDQKAIEVIDKLTQKWLRIDTTTEPIQGQLLAIEGKLLLFREVCVPIKAVRAIELHAVDNPIR
ncbi:MAG: hypothetical protein ORN27_05760 [Rhodoluna sp.]|nr:hypothetical protein [Rhodoluna sp.]